VSLHLVLHALAVKKHADVLALAEFTGLTQAELTHLLAGAAASGRVVAAQGKYVLTPLARLALDGQYTREYADLRANAAFVQAYTSFEQINIQLKSLITDWQTIEVGGARVANDHSDASYDMRTIDRLGNLHERAGKILAQLVTGPYTVWNEMAFKIYYLLLLVISAIILRHFAHVRSIERS